MGVARRGFERIGDLFRVLEPLRGWEPTVCNLIGERVSLNDCQNERRMPSISSMP